MIRAKTNILNVNKQIMFLMNEYSIDISISLIALAIRQSLKPRWSTTWSMGSLMGTNKAACGVKLLLMTVSSYQVDCVSFCTLLKT